MPDTPVGPMTIVHLLLDCRGRYGRQCGQAALARSPLRCENLTGGRARLRILSNLSDRRLAWATCRIPVRVFAGGDLEAVEVARGVAEANALPGLTPTAPPLTTRAS